MEIPRQWREQPTRIRFEGSVKELNNSDIKVFKYPGGEIPLVGSYEQIRARFTKRGFTEKATDEILFRFWSGIPAEAPISLGEVAESFFQLVGSEVRKQSGGKEKLRVNSLPRKIAGSAFVSAGADD